MDGMAALAVNAAKVARRYQFETFSVGVSMPEGVQEREDELRSDLKLKGNQTAKSQAAGIVSQVVSARLRKKVDKLRPDLTLLVDVGVRATSAVARPLYFYGRYIKPRGISQRRELCRKCSGAGCKDCEGTGFERKSSVEEVLRKKMMGFTGSQKLKFTWIGSEDRESRVYPPGRPFVVEAKSPLKRRIPRKFAARFKGGQVAVTRGKVLKSKPTRLPSFRFRTEILGTVAAEVGADGLGELRRRFRNTEVRFERPYEKPTTKLVYRVRARAKGRSLLIDAELDGGLPVKRFVSGELVSPSVSEVLKTEVRCRRFDICRVKETGEFEFAEVSWQQKKN
jgi:tRNA pseudouridine synthase 10